MDISALKSQLSIVDILSSYLPLKKQGANYVCPCPFHSEKSASFVVSESKGIYHCFGCGAGGDVFKFLQEYRHIDFKESVKEICDRLGVAYTFKGKRDSSYNASLELCEKINSFFIQRLTLNDERTQKIRAYLINRGLSPEDMQHYDIGLAPQGFEIQKILNKQELELALELGILHFKERYYSPFSGRITFGIRNASHKLIGFSSRTHPYDDFKQSAKYINSKSSRLFAKSQTLYLLSEAKSSIKAENKCILVEGYMDAIALHKLGRKYSVATCGTAFNKEHLSQILKLSDDVEIGLCFDNDEAGSKAALRSLQLLFELRHFNVYILKLQSQAKDIGEVLEKGENLSFKAYDGFAYYVSTLLNTASTKQKDKIYKEIVELVRAQDFFTKDKLATTLSSLLKVSKDEILTHKLAFNPKEHSHLKITYKSILSDETLTYIASESIESYELEEYEESYLAFLRDKSLDERAKALLLDESVPILHDREAFAKALCFLRQNRLKKLLENAKSRGDTRQMIALRQELNPYNQRPNPLQ